MPAGPPLGKAARHCAAGPMRCIIFAFYTSAGKVSLVSEISHALEKSSQPRALDYAMALCTVVIWGGSFAATKYALAQAEPSLILCLRLVMTLPVLAAGCAASREMRLPSAREAAVLAFMGFQGICFHQGIQAVAMKTAGAGNANWIMVASPAVVAALGWLFLGEKISRRASLGLVLASAGVALVLSAGTAKGTAESASFGSFGDWLMIASVFNWGIYLILSRRFLKAEMSPSFSIFWELVFASLFAFAATLALGTDYSVVPSFTAGTWSAILFLGALNSGLAKLIWSKELYAVPVAKLTVFQFLQPVAGMVISYMLLGERYTVWLALGAAMIVAGIWRVNKR